MSSGSGPDDRDRELARLRRRLERERAARRESERIAEEALRRMYDADELKTVLMGTVSHELRTPATVIGGLARHLLDNYDELGEELRRDIARRIAARADGLAGLIERVLQLASLEVDTIAGQFEQLELAGWLGPLLEELGEHDEHAIELRLAPGASVWCHPTALRQIVANIVGNAQRYAPPATPITVEVVDLPTGAELRIADRGPGIHPDDRERVFEPFYRGVGDHVTRTSGFGLGLSVVRRLATLVGGEVSVHDGPDGGAEFRLRFGDRPVGAEG